MRTLLVAVALAVSVAIAPVANADEVSFVEDMNDAGFTNDNGYKAEVAVGMHICSELLAGDTSWHQAHSLYLTSRMRTESEAQQFVNIAIKDLCP